MAKRGRPAQFDEPTVPFAVRLPQSTYDRLMRLSLEKNKAAADLTRELLRIFVSRNCGGDRAA